MEKYLYGSLSSKQVEEMKFTKRADNVKIVNHPVYGTVYVCPYPPQHFPNLRQNAQQIRYRETRGKKFLE